MVPRVAPPANMSQASRAMPSMTLGNGTSKVQASQSMSMRSARVPAAQLTSAMSGFGASPESGKRDFTSLVQRARAGPSTMRLGGVTPAAAAPLNKTGGFLSSFTSMLAGPVAAARTNRAATVKMSAAPSGTAGFSAAASERRVAKSLVKEMTAEEKEEFNKLPALEIDDLECVHYLQTISEGWAYPLERFMNEQELLESMNMNTITDKNGEKHILSVPITQHVTTEQKEKLEGASRIAIRCAAISPDVLAVIENPVFFENRKEEIATKTFGTRSKLHPKIARMEEQGDWLVSGDSMRFTQRIKYNDGLDHYRMTPEEIFKVAEERGADAVYAFQVRNPLHNGHCLLLKDTREQLIKMGYKNPLLLLHPLGGWMKDDDVPLDYRMRQH